MKQESRICQSCKQNFTIEPEDFAFYEQIKVPPPTFCWECRNQRRMASHRNRTMYKATCKLCKKEIISMFSPDSPFVGYCSPCWNGDGWDPMSYGREYDFSKSFFEQFHELYKVVPQLAARMINSPGCRYCDATVDSKDCYMLFGGYKCQDCMYGEPILSKHTVDSDNVLNADRTYGSTSATNVFNAKFVDYSEDCIDSSLLLDCKGCTSCFGCINLRNQQYCIFNKQCTKDEYKKQMQYWDLGSYARMQEAQERFAALCLQTPHRFAYFTNAVDCTGEDIQNSKNAKYCFIAKGGIENCKYMYVAGLLLKDSYDVTGCGDKAQLLYESSSVIASDRIIGGDWANNSRDVEYSNYTRNSSNIFGCVSLTHKKFCILNKQYTEEEYHALRKKIIQHMNDIPYTDKKGRVYRYGEYFPAELSAYPYNESWAFSSYPLTKQQTIEAGYNWHDHASTQHNIDVYVKDLPDHIRDADDSLANKAIECFHKGECNEICTSAFRIIPEELRFYKEMNIALPRYCPNCRYAQRFAKRNPLKLWHRKCAKCPNEFETAYAPERKEIIYCQECYNREFL